MTTKQLLEMKDRLGLAFTALIDSFEVEGDDGICVSDVEAATHEVNGIMYELNEMLLND